MTLENIFLIPTVPKDICKMSNNNYLAKAARHLAEIFLRCLKEIFFENLNSVLEKRCLDILERHLKDISEVSPRHCQDNEAVFKISKKQLL